MHIPSLVGIEKTFINTCYALQILDGLQYLHWRGLCHLDLQPDNVVMYGVRSVQIKLVDLGSAHRVTKLGVKVPVVGHPDYMCKFEEDIHLEQYTR